MITYGAGRVENGIRSIYFPPHRVSCLRIGASDEAGRDRIKVSRLKVRQIAHSAIKKKRTVLLIKK